MLDILKFIFQDFIHFIGTIILIYVIGESIGGVVSHKIISIKSKQK